MGMRSLSGTPLIETTPKKTRQGKGKHTRLTRHFEIDVLRKSH